MKNEREIDFRYAPQSSWTAICRPDDPYKTLVDEQGRLLYGFKENGFKCVYEFHVQTDRQPLQVTQSTESARRPIVRTTFSYPQVTLELTAFGHKHDGQRRTDVVLWRIHTEESSIMTHFQVQTQGKGVVFKGNSPEDSHKIYAIGIGETEDDASLAFVSTQSLAPGFACDYGPSSALRTVRKLVRQGEVLEGAIIVPLNYQDPAGLDLAWAREALDDERSYWDTLQLSPLKLEVPDDRMMDMITACARNILQAREIKEGIPEFQVGAAHYRGLWVVDGHFMLEAAWYLGHADEAFHGLNALLRRAKPDGSIAQQPHHIKETGIALATMVRQCELRGDMDKLQSLWPIVKRAVGHIEWLREQSKLRGPDAPEYGLMPPAYGDGGLSGRRPEYTTPLWTLVGLKFITEAAERLGFTDDAIAFRSSYESLLKAFYEHAEKDMRTLPDGTPYLPMLKPGPSEYVGEPHWIEGELPGIPDNPWQRVTPTTATWALAHAIYPGEVFKKDDAIVRNFCHLLELTDDDEGVPSGTGWEPYQTMWVYSSSFYAHVWLLCGRPDKTVDYLYAFANHATPTRVWREEQAFQHTHHGYWVGDMPHNWASAEFIRLIRNMLVLETGNRLELLAGLPKDWIISKKPVFVERTPTRYGAVSLKMEVQADGAVRIEVKQDAAWPLKPDGCRLHLTALKLAGLRDARLDGAAIPTEDDVLSLPVGVEVSTFVGRIVFEDSE